MDEKKSALKAIREKCLDCVCGQANEVKLCPVKDCSLYPFRFGKNPFNKRNLTEEQKKAASDRLKALHERKKSDGQEDS